MSDDSRPPDRKDAPTTSSPAFNPKARQSSVGAALYSYATGAQPNTPNITGKTKPMPAPVPAPTPAVAPPAQPTVSLAEGLNRAMQLAQDARLEDALALCRELAAAHPTNPDVFHLSGVLYLQSGESAEALKFLERAVELAPDYLDALINLATAQHRDGNPGGAETSLRRAVELDPQSWEATFNYGNLLFEVGRSAEAVAPLRQAEALRPDSIETLVRLSEALVAANFSDESADILRRIIELEPTDVMALSELANYHMDREEYSDAEELLRHTVALAPSVPGLHGKLGYVLLCQNKESESIAATEIELQRNPGSTDLLINLGFALMALEKFDGAIEKFGEAVRHSPKNAMAQANLGVALARTGRHEDAIPHLLQANELEPDSPSTLFVLGNAYRATAAFDEAVPIYQQALALDPSSAGGYWELGHALEMSGQSEDAIKAYEECLIREPDNSVAQHLRAALTGETPTDAPSDYAAELFDDYARNFEQSLVDDLQYADPQKFRAILEDIAGPKAGHTTAPFPRVMDLGCGTGLMGAAIRDLSENLTGIDVSENMLEVSAEKGIYQSLIHADVVAYLATQPTDPVYDLVTAADVLTYIGALEAVFAGVRARLASGGLFVFSVEAADAGTYMLRRSGRFAHAESYVRATAAVHGFEIERVDTSVMRNDGDEPISEYICVLRATASGQ